MAPQHEPRERHGSHPIAEWVEPPPERPHGERMMEDLEMERSTGGLSALPVTWSGMKELVYVITVVLALAGAYYGIRGEIQDGHRDTQELAARVLVIEHGRAENLPRLEEQIRNNAIQDTRIQNLVDSLGRVVATVGDLARIVAAQGDLIHETHEHEAVLEERLGHVGPHDR